MNEEVFYPPQADTYPNALHIIPAPNTYEAIKSVVSHSRNNEADIGQLQNCEVIAIHNNNDFEGSDEFEYNFQGVTESLTVHNLSHTDLDAETDQLSGIVGTRDMGNNELENTHQKPSTSKPDQTDPEKYVNNDTETLKKVINNPIFYKDTQHLKIDQ